MRSNKRHRPISLKPLLIAMAASGLLIAEQGLADSYEVTNLADSGSGSLRNILDTANVIAGPHTITFQSGLSGTLTLTTGQLEIQQPMTITGPGATLITISGNGSVQGPPSGPSRVFYIADNLDEAQIDPIPDEEGVTIEGLHITAGNGKAVAIDDPGPGGCILSDSRLILVDSVVSECTANDLGGGVHVTSNAEDGDGKYDLGLFRSTITGNTVTCTGSTTYCMGGGTSTGFDGVVTHGTAAKYSRISDNAVIVGAGPFDNITQAGGGLASPASIILASTITGNSLSGNPTTTTEGGQNGDLVRMGGGVFSYMNFLVNSTIDGNTITDGTGTVAGQRIMAGGGLASVFGGVLQSTVSGNSVPAEFHGGGIAFMNDGTLSGQSKYGYEVISNSTVTGNSGASGLAFLGKYGTPMPTPAADQLVINSTIVANTAGGVDVYCEAVECPISGADNLVESHTNADFANPPITADPQLGPLVNNGGFSTGAPGATGTGPIRTHALGGHSPAINQGNIDFGGGIDQDQRGSQNAAGRAFPRVNEGRADIGAYEVQTRSIPTLSPLAMGLLSGLLAWFGWRRRQR